jgi:transcriptional regulator with GAF, ATPase, and Fis domain
MTPHDGLSWPASPDSYGVSALFEARDRGDIDSLVFSEALHVATRTDIGFFDALAGFLARTFHADIVLLGVFEDQEEPAIQTLAVSAKGLRAELFRYELAGTPCERVIGPGQICLYQSGVAERYPEDQILEDMQAEGYCGVPLFDIDGELLGLLALITCDPIEDPETLVAIVRVFAERAALELEYSLLVHAYPTARHRLIEKRDQHDQELREAIEDGES